MKKIVLLGWLACCGLALAGPPGIKAPPATKVGQSTRPTNPDGRKGGMAHQAKVKEVVADVEARGLKAEREHMVVTPAGTKPKRFVDVAGVNPATGQVEEMHQVGRQTKSGASVAREKRALDDVQKAKGTRPKFHPYK